MESRDATYIEHIISMRAKEANIPDLLVKDPIPQSVNGPIPKLELRRSKRQITQKSLGDDFVTYVVDDEP